MNLNSAFLDCALACQGKSKLNANALAAIVERNFLDAWSRFLPKKASGRFSPAELGSKLTKRNADAIAPFLADVGFEAWRDYMMVLWRHAPPKFLKLLADMKAGRVKTEAAPPIVATPAALKDVDPVLVSFFKPPSKKEIDRAVEQPFKGHTWRHRLEAHTEDVGKLERRIRAGIAKGLTHQQIAKEIRPLMSGSLANVKALARTEVHRVTTQIGMQTTKDAVGEAQIGWVYTATKDDVTRIEHAALDGTRWRVDDPELPIPPIEPNCRCGLTPEMKRLEDLGLPKEIADLFGPKETATIDGPAPGTTSYAKWFDGISAERKREIAGNEIADKLKGKLKWNSLLKRMNIRKPKGRTLKQLLAKKPPLETGLGSLDDDDGIFG